MSTGRSGGPLAGITGAVLLGGASRRMGRDKARLRIEGERDAPLVSRTAGLLATLLDEVLLVGGDPPPGQPWRRVADPAGPQCALRGLVGALEAARGAHVLVVATDLPGLGAPLLLALIAAPEADCVAPRGEGGLEPVCGLYRRDVVLPAARRALAEGRLSLRALLEELDVVALEGDDLRAVDPGGLGLANLNTPSDLEAFRRRIGCATMR